MFTEYDQLLFINKQLLISNRTYNYRYHANKITNIIDKIIMKRKLVTLLMLRNRSESPFYNLPIELFEQILPSDLKSFYKSKIGLKN
jgi:hypothetical protein